MAQDTCAVDGCVKPTKRRGWCGGHLARWRRHGDPLGGGGPRKPPITTRRGASLEERFWIKVQKTDTCWLWLGSRDSGGYGQIRVDGKGRKAHRVSWLLAGNELVADLDIDHLCRVRHCVRPDHLELVTRAVNTYRGVGIGAINAAKTHCPAGHPYTEKDTYRWPGAPTASRQCRTCRSRKRLTSP